MKTLIIDANNMAHRARHAYSLSFGGRDTSVTYGFLAMLIAAIKANKPQSVIVCWDRGRPDYRTRLIPSYKATRVHSTDDASYASLISQMEELIDILPCFGVLQVRRLGIEADDLAYHASKMLEQSVILSNDKDLLQAVSATTSVRPSSDKPEVTLNNFEKVTGLPTSAHYLTYRALVGDSSDNLSGCPGIGPKTAATLLSNVAEQHTLGDLLSNAKGAARAKLTEYMDSGLYESTRAVMCLSEDYCGARHTLLNTPWKPYRNKEIVKWCLERGFASFVETGMSVIFGRLVPPQFNSNGLKVPLVWNYRRWGGLGNGIAQSNK